MHFQFNTQNLLLVGVLSHLLLSTAKLVWKTPRQQAQIDAIEGKVDTVLGEVQQVLPAQEPTPPQAATLPKREGEGMLLAAAKDNAANNSANNSANSAQGGAS